MVPACSQGLPNSVDHSLRIAIGIGADDNSARRAHKMNAEVHNAHLSHIGPSKEDVTTETWPANTISTDTRA